MYGAVTAVCMRELDWHPGDMVSVTLWGCKGWQGSWSLLEGLRPWYWCWGLAFMHASPQLCACGIALCMGLKCKHESESNALWCWDASPELCFGGPLHWLRTPGCQPWSALSRHWNQWTLAQSCAVEALEHLDTGSGVCCGGLGVRRYTRTAVRRCGLGTTGHRPKDWNT